MKEERFSNREITLMFTEIKNTLVEHAETHKEILDQVKYTNGKLKRVVFILTIVGSVTATLFAMNGSALIDFVLKII